MGLTYSSPKKQNFYQLNMKPNDQYLLDRAYRQKNKGYTFVMLYQQEWGKLAAAVALHIIKHSPVWLTPLITASIIDLLAHPAGDTLWYITLYGFALIVVLLLNIPGHYWFTWFTSVAIRNVELALRSALTRRLQQLSFNFYYRHNTGALQTKLLRDVEQFGQLTRQLFDVGVGAGVTLLAGLAITAGRVPHFLLFYLITIPLAAVVISTMRQALNQRNNLFRQEIEQMSSRVIEMLQMIPLARAHSLEKFEIERLEAEFADVRAAGLQVDAITALFGAINWVSFNLFNFFCLLVAAAVYLHQWWPITVGDVLLLTSYFSSITSSLLVFIGFLPELSKGAEALKSMGEVLESPDLEKNEGKLAVPEVEGAFLFEDVSFQYPQTIEPSIAHFNLEVRPGESVAIVGPSGAGKSTLLNLLIGFLRPTSGRVLLDGRDMNELDLRDYRQFLSIVPQESLLFAGTIRENITYGRGDISDERLWQALKSANAAEFVRELPEGLNSKLGERGARLSGGQKQRLAIARALIRNPRVLILDEATSALDSSSEAQIQQALGRLMTGRTTFMVAHRLSTIRHAGRIVVLERGQMVEIGSHEELLAQNGVYTRLLQASAE